MSNIGNDWIKILDILRDKVTPVSFSTWFEPLVPVRNDTELSIIYLITDDDFKLRILKERYLDVLEECAKSVFDKDYKVIINVSDENDTADNVSHTESSSARNMKVLETFPDEFILNPNYSFENFIVGDNNKYANAAALAVAENPAEAYNPLFIYGGSGLGKTHLMHAIGHYILKHHSDLKVLYVSSEMFTNELVKALREKNKAGGGIKYFKQKYRNVDVLLIDDIQFIQGKESTETEFFHTFNTLYQNNKQIIISSDRSPNKLELLTDRLRSRFSWNLVADIQPPEYETRVAILLKKAELENVNVDGNVREVIDLIAEKIKYNVRELEGAFSRVVSFSLLMNEDITPVFARKVLKDVFTAGEFNLSCEMIKKQVCKKYDISISDIESSKRARAYTLPRQIAMYLCREMTNSSFPKIGECFGGKDHSTVLHAYEKIKKGMDENPALKESVDEMKDIINSN